MITLLQDVFHRLRQRLQMLMNSTDNEPLECENEATTLPSTLAESEVHAEHSETTGLAGYSISADTNAIGGTCDGGLYNHTHYESAAPPTV